MIEVRGRFFRCGRCTFKRDCHPRVQAVMGGEPFLCEEFEVDPDLEDDREIVADEQGSEA